MLSLIPRTSPGPQLRRRPALLGVVALLVAGSGVLARGEDEAPMPWCSTGVDGWCILRRFEGTVPNGELGFRFGEPLDADGDGVPDVAGGSRFKLQHGTQQSGDATVWSGATGRPIRTWDGAWDDALFGHTAVLIPDVSSDGLADVVIAAPHARVESHARGIVVARSPKTGAELWRRTETEGENLGWDVALAGDQNGDGSVDLFVGATAERDGRVYLLSGRDGALLETYNVDANGEGFGWYVARLGDLDDDGRADLAVGAPSAVNAAGARVGGAWVLAARGGRVLRHWEGVDPRGGFGSIVTGLDDLDGDGVGDVAVSAPGTEDQTRTLPGHVLVWSGRSGARVHLFEGGQPGELYGRMVVGTADLDGDGVGDMAIGAPLHRRGDDDRVGRLELRSGRTGAVLAELFGDAANCWFGWHVRRTPDPDGRGRPALLIASLRHPVDGKVGAGVLDLVVRRAASEAGDQGTTTRGALRSDIK